jgi:membrane protease YdiL (CAAX protease family)
VLGLYGIGILVNALPEELFFRGLLLPRLERVLGSSLNALVLSALLFNALHVPIEIANGASLPVALLGVFGIGYPSGLIWGYLYVRTRSIVPGTLWHAANGNLGFLLLDV